MRDSAVTESLTPAALPTIETGDKITFAGWGTSARGHQVCNGRSKKTGRKMKVKTLTVFEATGAAKYLIAA